MTPPTLHLGYAVGSGDPVAIPLKHMCVTGQTQESGKTTTLEALIRRAGAAHAFVTFITKRGERAFSTGEAPSHVLPPYFREQADWVFVSSLIDATMGGKNKILHSFLMKVCRNTQTLAEVLDNVRAARDQSRRSFDEAIYEQILGYLQLVVPQLRDLRAAVGIHLWRGLNVMDLSDLSPEVQALCIRSTIDYIHEHEENTIVVIPEAWEFLPEGRGSPVKAAAERLIRKGAALGNYVWIDSQDLAGVWKTVVRACAVVLIGVQREANEIKRTLANIPAGVAKPKADAIAQLELGQFYACWGKHVVRTYVQPSWMSAVEACTVATSDGSVHITRASPTEETAFRRATQGRRGIVLFDEEPVGPDSFGGTDEGSHYDTSAHRALREMREDTVTKQEAEDLQRDNRALRQMNAQLHNQVAELRRTVDSLSRLQPQPVSRSGKKGGSDVVEDLGPGPILLHQGAPDIQGIVKAVLLELEKQPRLLKIAVMIPEIEIQSTIEPVTMDITSWMGRIAKMIKDGFFDQVTSANAAWTEGKRHGMQGAAARAYEACDKLVKLGYLTKEDGGYQSVAAMKKHIRAA